MFIKVHIEIKEGKRKIVSFSNLEQHLREGQFYVADGLLLYLEKTSWRREQDNLNKNTLRRKDGRTRIIFENGTMSNMYYRSLGKLLYSNGKMVTNTYQGIEKELFINSGLLKEKDLESGWLYILKTKSTNKELAGIKDLYKIGFTSEPVDDRIRNAKTKQLIYLQMFKKLQHIRFITEMQIN